ncbi:hypothetical protein TNCV_1682401 [Trichonephila clavipes]|nr:hypothetical protein TNCV_1682401 [Trichonephila clavipes]
MTSKWSPKSPPTRSPKMMPTWLYRQDFAKFSFNRHYNQDDAFPPSVPGERESFSIYSSGAKGASGGRLNRRSAGRRRSRPKSIWDRE